MNESAGDQFTDVVASHLALSRTERLDATDDADEDAPPAPAREGLPRSFRMRHDAHYVDELMSRAVDGPDRDRDYVSRRAPAGLSTPADEVEKPIAPALSADRLLPALALIAERLESIATHSGGIRPQLSAPSFIEQSLQVEFVRTTRLARAAAILHQQEPLLRDQVLAQEIADEVTRMAGPVARLAGVDFCVAVDDGGFAILAESALVVQGVVGTVDAIVDLMLAAPRHASRGGRPAAPKISISLQSVTVRPAIILDLFCPTLTISAGHAERFFHNADEDYRHAPAAGLLLAAAAHIVAAHGGRADAKRHATGVTVTYVFPHTP